MYFIEFSHALLEKDRRRPQDERDKKNSHARPRGGWAEDKKAPPLPKVRREPRAQIYSAGRDEFIRPNSPLDGGGGCASLPRRVINEALKIQGARISHKLYLSKEREGAPERKPQSETERPSEFREGPGETERARERDGRASLAANVTNQSQIARDTCRGCPSD